MLSTSDPTSRDEPLWKRFQEESESVPFPLLVLDDSATIRRCTPSACRLLQHDPGSLAEQSFLSLVHGRNVQRVMRDLAHLVHRRLQTASWLLRLRAGGGRWRWYRAVVRASGATASGAAADGRPVLFVRLRPA